VKPPAALEAEKKLVGETAAKWVPSGSRIGIGSGTTAAYFIRALGRRVREEDLQLSGIPTSNASEQLAREVGIPLIEPERGLRLDFTVDGADEISPDLNLIKGGGGKHFREKVIANASKYLFAIADSSKRVPVLGSVPVPVEVVPFPFPWVVDALAQLGSTPILREANHSPVLTDQGNWIVDCHFGSIAEPVKLGEELDRIPGILEHGLFLNLAKLALIADGNKLTLLRPGTATTVTDSASVLPALDPQSPAAL